MGELVPLPKVGDVFSDVRGEDRTLRVSCHDEVGVVVVSIWAAGRCRASFHLALDEVPDLVDALAPPPSAPGLVARATGWIARAGRGWSGRSAA